MPCGIVFDMDGVLVDSEGAHDVSWRRLAEKYDFELPDDAFVDSYGRTTRDILGRIFGSKLDEATLRTYDQAKETIYREIVADSIPLMNGVHELLQALTDKGHRLAVGTSGPGENLALVLTQGKLERFFAAAVHGFDVQHGKPAPDIFLLAAKRAQIEPKHAVVIEDAPAGIRAAIAAGMVPIGVTSTHTAVQLLESGASKVVSETGALSSTLIQETWEAARSTNN